MHCLSVVFSAISAGAAVAGAELSVEDRRNLAAAFGPGIRLEPASAPSTANPSDFLAADEGQQVYQILNGPNAGHLEIHRRSRTRAGDWRYDLGAGEVGFLDEVGGGDLAVHGIEDHADQVITRYSPPEPVLFKNSAEGFQRKLRMEVKIFELDRPENLSHEGLLEVTYTDLGGFRLILPDRHYDALLVKMEYRGSIGPARLEAVQYRFLTPRLGMVATAEFRNVSAFFLYRTHGEFAKVLSGPVPGSRASAGASSGPLVQQ